MVESRTRELANHVKDEYKLGVTENELENFIWQLQMYNMHEQLIIERVRDKFEIEEDEIWIEIPDEYDRDDWR